MQGHPDLRGGGPAGVDAVQRGAVAVVAVLVAHLGHRVHVLPALTRRQPCQVGVQRQGLGPEAVLGRDGGQHHPRHRRGGGDLHQAVQHVLGGQGQVEVVVAGHQHQGVGVHRPVGGDAVQHVLGRGARVRPAAGHVHPPAGGPPRPRPLAEDAGVEVGAVHLGDGVPDDHHAQRGGGRGAGCRRRLRGWAGAPGQDHHRTQQPARHRPPPHREPDPTSWAGGAAGRPPGPAAGRRGRRPATTARPSRTACTTDRCGR
ncbi:unannotated protein [freshwater metagenome]|uniref:Unannotated protein n=1 Tax=freshwater metagenome TaxID=449393 RepID=A0A6J7GMI7_9ZZZZ